MKFIKAWLLGLLYSLISSLIDGCIAYLLLDSTFHLGFGVWWGIAFVGMQIVTSGTVSLRNRS